MGPNEYLAPANQPAGVNGSVFGVSQQPTFINNNDSIYSTNNLPEFQAVDRAMLETLYDPRMPGDPSYGYDSVVPIVWDDNTRYEPAVVSSGGGGTFTIDFDVAATDANQKTVTNDTAMEDNYNIVESPAGYSIPVNHKLHVTFACDFENNNTDVICHVAGYSALPDQQPTNFGNADDFSNPPGRQKQADICVYVQGQPDVHLHMDRVSLGPWTNSLNSDTQYIWADWSPVTPGDLSAWKLDKLGFVKP